MGRKVRHYDSLFFTYSAFFLVKVLYVHMPTLYATSRAIRFIIAPDQVQVPGGIYSMSISCRLMKKGMVLLF